MNVNHLKYFYDSVREGSLQNAARLNNVTPGAVSQAILKLEQFFDVQLIHHSKNRFELTEQGKILYDTCPPLFSSVQSVLTKMEDAKNPFTGELNFGTQQSIASTILPSILNEFKKIHPDIKVNFNMGFSTHMKRLLEQREINFVITMDHFNFANHHKVQLFEGNFVFISSSKAQKILDKGFLVTEYSMKIYKLNSLYKKMKGSEFPVQMRIDSWGVIKKMALEGQGIGFIPDFILNLDEKKYILDNFDLPKIKYSICCVYPKTHTLNAKSRAFLDNFKAQT
jgi:LysR family carnitine catabolism transcriptional activator